MPEFLRKLAPNTQTLLTCVRCRGEFLALPALLAPVSWVSRIFLIASIPTISEEVLRCFVHCAVRVVANSCFNFINLRLGL